MLASGTSASSQLSGRSRCSPTRRRDSSRPLEKARTGSGQLKTRILCRPTIAIVALACVAAGHNEQRAGRDRPSRSVGGCRRDAPSGRQRRRCRGGRRVCADRGGAVLRWRRWWRVPALSRRQDQAHLCPRLPRGRPEEGATGHVPGRRQSGSEALAPRDQVGGRARRSRGPGCVPEALRQQEARRVFGRGARASRAGHKRDQ